MRAFLSSTFWDLRPERLAAQKAIDKLGHELEAMELFIAKPTEPLRAVLDNLRRCDFMVLLIGFRAGSLIPRRKGLTYTQAEYRLAKQLKIPVFVLVKTSRGRWQNLELKGSPKRLSLGMFHRTATQQYLPRHFASQKELKEQIVTALTDWDAQGRPGARRVFSTAQQFFRSQMSGRTLLDYEQTLRGRSRQQKEFDSFMKDPQKTVALLRGRGGIGKTKLLREWGERLRGWKVLLVSEAPHWHPEAFKELPNGKVLIIHDDAHRSGILNDLAVLTRDLRPVGQIKLMLAYRPSGSHLVEAAVSRFFGQELTFQMTQLEQLSRAEVRQIAVEVLGPKFMQYAEPLAIVSRDTPLVTVVGGKLIARRQIPPSLLANEDAFRRTVFDRFIDEQQGQLPDVDVNVRPLLELVAAIAPISPTDHRFLEKATTFLTLRSDQILKAVDALVRGGLLLKGGSLVRIVPDVLSDFLLERASIDSTGESTKFSDAVYEQFEDVFLSNLVRNLGELDWRITRHAASGSILEGMWAIIKSRFTAADAFERSQLLESIQAAAIVQPAPCLDLVNIAVVDEARPTATLLKDFSYTQKDVLKQLPPILSGMAYDPHYTTAAMSLLWDLGKGLNGNKDAAKAFESFASYGRYKPVSYNNAVAEFSYEKVDEPDAFLGEFSPLDLADKLLAKEGDFTDFEEMVFHIGSFILNYKVISTVRKKAFSAVEKALFSNAVRAGVRAVKSLERLISGYLPKLRGAPTSEEAKWQNKERFISLSLFERRVKAGPPLVPVMRQIRHVLDSLEKSRNVNSRHLRRARDIVASIRSDEVDLFDTFISASWQFDRLDSEGKFLSGDARRQSQIEHAWRFLETRYPSPSHKVGELERLYAWIRDSGLDSGDHLQFVDLMCRRDAAFCRVLADYIINEHPSDQVAWTLQVVLRNLRLDPAKYRSIATKAAAHGNPRIMQSAASSLFYIRPDDVTEGELELLIAMVPKSEFPVKMNVLSGLRWLAKDAAFRDYVVNTALLVDLGNDRKVADEFCKIFGPYGMGPVSLDPSQVRAILEKLVEVAELDEHNCEQLLMRWADIYPDDIFSFFLRRVEITLKKRAADDWGYTAVPRHVSLRKIASGPQLVPRLRSVIDKFIENNYERDIRKLFWSLTWLDEPTISLLEEYTQDQAETKVKAIIALLEDAPREIAFSHPQFTKQVLEAAGKLGTKYKDGAISLFVVNCRPGVFTGGAESPALSRIMDRARDLMKEYGSDPLLYPLYQGIKDFTEQTIRSLQISEADMRFEHS